MNTLWQILIGLLTIYVLGLGVGPLLKHAQSSAPIPAPNDALSAKWATLTAGDEGGKILGRLERLAFFGAFWIDAPIVIGAWLGFKVASKWNVWSNVISVPKTISGAEDVDYLIARRRWGSQVLMTFLIGTLSNVIIGFLGVLVGRHGYEFIRSLCG
jgi:hypothetical protein